MKNSLYICKKFVEYEKTDITHFIDGLRTDDEG